MGGGLQINLASFCKLENCLSGKSYQLADGSFGLWGIWYFMTQSGISSPLLRTSSWKLGRSVFHKYKPYTKQVSTEIFDTVNAKKNHSNATHIHLCAHIYGVERFHLSEFVLGSK